MAAVFLLRLGNVGDPSVIPSAFIGRVAPPMSLPPLEGLVVDGAQAPGFDTAALEGEVTVVNVWGSWCPPCRVEHPYLMQMAEDGRFRMVGLNYKDPNANALRFLTTYGNPYDAVGVDIAGRNAIDWGVYGAPETFLIGRDGVIRYRHVGPVTERVLAEDVMPELEALLAEPPPPSSPEA